MMYNIITQKQESYIKSKLDEILSNQEYSLRVYYGEIVKINIENKESISFETLEDINTILDVNTVGYDKEMNRLYIFTSLKNGA